MSVWLISLSIMFPRFIHVIACFGALFLFNAIMGYTTFYLSTHRLMAVWLVSIFWLLWKMLLWTFVCKWTCVFVVISCGICLCNCWSDDNSMFILFRNCQTVFQSDCAILHSHQQYMRSQLLHVLVSACYYLSFYCSPHSRCEVVYHCLDLHFCHGFIL